jgi:outer membrane protein assembly factor BamB
MRKGYYNVYDEFTGRFLFKTEVMDYPWDTPGFGAYDQQSAYGMFYREAYGGIYAFDWDTGKIVWKYKSLANPYETPYVDENGATVYSWYTGATIADGKLYSWNSEHTATQPITRGWGIHCINAFTGEGIWNVTGSMSPGAMADGYLTASNSYDGYMYVFGKGQSETTVTAPDVAVPLGTAITIKGTVLDKSPAQPGTPCVSKDSMTTEMEHNSPWAVNNVGFGATKP